MQIYPIYIDAKKPFKTGCRRIAREKSVWWPLSLEIAQAASALGLNVVHEVRIYNPWYLMLTFTPGTSISSSRLGQSWAS
jgi:signal recognition particle subunit SEC65